VDLEVDVCIQPDSTVKVLDVEKFEKVKEKGFISKKLFEAVKEETKRFSEANTI
jgi:protein associated with RNAse G/E